MVKVKLNHKLNRLPAQNTKYFAVSSPTQPLGLEWGLGANAPKQTRRLVNKDLFH